LLGLEGFYVESGTFFSRIQCLSKDGELLTGYTDAYIGEYGSASSGMFEVSGSAKLIVPYIESSQGNQLRYQWFCSYPENNYLDPYYNTLPDSILSVIEFPTSIDKFISYTFGEYQYYTTGRFVYNQSEYCFFIKDFGIGSDYIEVVTVPGLDKVSGISWTSEGILVIGETGNHIGKLILLDQNNNLSWERDFTCGADASVTPEYTTPLIDGSFISYQDLDMILRIAVVAEERIQIVYSEQLDEYVGAIPILSGDSTVTFAYLKDGIQYIKQIDNEGNQLWKTELPGIGYFGKGSMTYCRMPNSNATITISGCMPGGGYYVASLEVATGLMDYDAIYLPEKLKLSLFPTPFSDILNLDFETKTSGTVKFELFNIRGEKVATLMQDYYPQGSFIKQIYPVFLSNKDISSGMYFLRMDQNGEQITKKLMYFR
jgi:hypothetical protein